MTEGQVVRLSAAPSLQRRTPELSPLDQIDMVTGQGKAAITAAINVRSYLRSESEYVRRTGRVMLANLAELAQKSLANDEQQPTRRPGPITTAGRRAEFWLERRRNKLGILRSVPGSLRRVWTAVGVAMSILAAYAIVTQVWWVAIVLLTLRVLVSAVIGGGNDLPFEGRTTAGDSGTAIVTRCLSGHIADVLPLLGVSFVLYNSGRSLWAVGAAIAVVLMLISTMFRIAALQVGVRLPRHITERLFRVGGMIAGLLAVWKFQPVVPAGGAPLLSLFFAGAIGYAGIEITRTIVRLRQADIDTSTSTRRVDMVFSHGSDVQSFLFNVPAKTAARHRRKQNDPDSDAAAAS